MSRPAVFIAAGLLAIGTLYIADLVGSRMAALFLVGGGFGVTLYHASFGFTAAWRRFLVNGRGRGMRAQMVLLGATAIVFYPALDTGFLLDRAVNGFVAPVGFSVIAGAFLFGIGMQLGGGCGSGTLFTVGGGNTRMVVTLFFFVVGSVAGALHVGWWLDLGHLGAVSYVKRLGWEIALPAALAVFAGLAWLSHAYERRRHGSILTRDLGRKPPLRRLVQGPWPDGWGVAALVILAVLTLYLAGRPWGITSAFTIWGGKGLDALGIAVEPITSWGAVQGSIFFHTTSVMDFGIVLGALLAAGLAGKFAPVWRIAPRPLLAAIVGGLLLGYGARLAFGCNIGAFYSGIASGSLHGWLWLVSALAGNAVGVRLRPWFRLEVERA
ncbi:MAG: YeeE/YedE family protein [Alphaproteobacteria bacterium]|nr:YeeE/YedE family protein [Alphaproteobacteria bacterium]